MTLSALRGSNVLLAFFPSAFSSVCTAEMGAFSDDFDQFRGFDTVVLPISVDHVDSLQAFREKEGIRVDLLSDFKREVSRRYGTLIEEAFLSNRAYVLVDRQGIIRWAFAEPNPGSRRENAELTGQIRKLP